MLGLPSPVLRGTLASQDPPAAELSSLSFDGGARSHTNGEILSPKRILLEHPHRATGVR